MRAKGGAAIIGVEIVFLFLVGCDNTQLAPDAIVSPMNHPPAVTGTPATSVVVGSVYHFVPTATDADNDLLTFSITNKPSWATFTSNDGMLHGTPVVTDVGTTLGIVISVTDRHASVSLPAFNLAVTESAMTLALRSGDAGNVTEQELVAEANTTAAAINARREQTSKRIFKLADNGATTTFSITGINWNPSHDSVWFDSVSMGGNFPILVSNASAKGSSLRDKALAMAGIKESGARYAVMGANPLHDLTRTGEPGGTGNAQMQAFLKSLIEWLTQRNNLATGSFKVVVAHQRDSYWFRHDTTTIRWLTNAYPTVTVNAADACENSALANCLVGADLLVIGLQGSTGDDNYNIPLDLNATMSAVRDAQARGIPVLYLQADGGMTPLGDALMGYFGLKTTDNYWDQVILTDFTPTGLLSNDGPVGTMGAIQTAMNVLNAGTLNFGFSDTNCPNNFGTVTCDPSLVMDGATGKTMQTQFTDGADALRSALNYLDIKGVNLFDQDDDFRFLKVAVLLADKYRFNITYPMDKTATNDTSFFKALFSDYAVHYARTNNLSQPNMGDFAGTIQAQAALNMSVGINKTLSYTPTVYREFTSTGLYAPPGKTITVHRTDSGTSTVMLRFNFLRNTTRLWNTNQYSRPRYMASPTVTLNAGQTYTFSTPYGGPIYVGWDAVASGATPFTLAFNGVLENPLLMAFDENSITAFLNSITVANSNWVDIKTPFVEIHSLKSHMLEAFSSQDGNKSNGYTPQDVQAYIYDLNHYLIASNLSYAGFSGEGLFPLSAEVEAFCATRGLVSASYSGSTKNLCTDNVIHRKPKIQHINSDVHAACGSLCSGNPFDSGGYIDPLGWGESHELGHNLQRARTKVYGGRSGEVSNNIHPLHTSWLWTVDKGLAKHPDLDRPSNKGAFDILQRAIASGAVANITHPLWSGTGTYDNAFERLSFYIQLVYTQQSWDLYTKLFLMERIFTDAIKTDATWNEAKALLGFGAYTKLDAGNISGNDFLYISASVIAQKNYSDYFGAWGIEVSQAAKDQVTANGLTVQIPKRFYYVHNELPAVMPTDADTIPLDGTSVWADPTP